MIRQCYVCQKFMGEKEPFEKKIVTSGICDECFPKELEKLRQYMETRKNERIHEGLEQDSERD